MELLKEIICIIEVTILIYFGLASLYLLFFAVLELFYKSPKQQKGNIKCRIVIIIFDLGVKSKLVQAIESSLNQDYPLGQFEVVIISNTHLKRYDKLPQFPVKIIQHKRRSKELSQELEIVLSELKNDFDLTLVINSRNRLDINFLYHISLAYQKGKQIIQCHRIIKGLKTTRAKYIGITEEINSYIFRKGHVTLGLSASILCWGIAYDFKLLKQILLNSKRLKYNNLNKIIENEILERGIKISYLDRTCFYERFSQNSFEYEQQRIKWLYSNKLYLKSVLSLFKKMKFKNINIINKLFQLILLPKTLFYTSILIGFFLSMLVDWFKYNNPGKIWFWLIVLAINIVAIILSVPKRFYERKYLNILRLIPKILSLISYVFLNQKDAIDNVKRPFVNNTLKL